MRRHPTRIAQGIVPSWPLSRRPVPIAVAGLALLSACADHAPRCGPGLGQPMTAFTMFFGRSVADRGEVSETEWDAFVEGPMTRALPNGFTVFGARGAWFSPRMQRTIHEATKVVLVTLPDSPDSLDAVHGVRSDYQVRFNQQLVGMTALPVCASF